MSQLKPWKYPRIWRFFIRFLCICLAIIIPILILLGLILSGLITPIICYTNKVPKSEFD